MVNRGTSARLFCGALANAHRRRISVLLNSNGRQCVSQLAREMGISRPLLHLHLQRLEGAGLVSSEPELFADGQALKYFEVTRFALKINPATITPAAVTPAEALSQPC